MRDSSGTIEPIHVDLRRWSLSSVHLKWILAHHVWGARWCFGLSVSKWQRDQICEESEPFTLRLQMRRCSQPTHFSFQHCFNITTLLFSCSSTTHTPLWSFMGSKPSNTANAANKQRDVPQQSKLTLGMISAMWKIRNDTHNLWQNYWIYDLIRNKNLTKRIFNC